MLRVFLGLAVACALTLLMAIGVGLSPLHLKRSAITDKCIPRLEVLGCVVDATGLVPCVPRLPFKKPFNIIFT
jgi:hypothetical protein